MRGRMPARPLGEVADAAVRVFTDKGFGSAGISDVTAALGLSHGALYTYARSKQALLYLALVRAVRPDAVDSLATPVADPTAEDIIALADTWATNRAVLPTLTRALAADPDPDPASAGGTGAPGGPMGGNPDLFAAAKLDAQAAAKHRGRSAAESGGLGGSAPDGPPHGSGESRTAGPATSGRSGSAGSGGSAGVGPDGSGESRAAGAAASGGSAVAEDRGQPGADLAGSGGSAGDRAVAAEFGAVVDELYDLISDNRRILQLVEQCSAELPDLAQWYFVGRRREMLAQLGDYLARRIESGHLAAVPDVPVAARYIVETIAWFAMHRHGDPDSAMLDDAASRRTVTHLLRTSFLDTTGGFS